MGARPSIFVGAAILFATGCSIVAGVNFGDVHGKDEIAGGADAGDASTGGDGGSIVIDGGGSVVEDGATIILADAGCAADESSCNGACVKKTDPQFGCGSAACMPCSLPLTTSAKCVAGKCVPDTCAQGRADCDRDPATGCEADLSAPANCGSCSVACKAPSGLCSPTGCVGACPAGTQSCGTSCVDTGNSVTNCGACSKVCGSAANSDPTCAGGQCGIACHSGFQDCDSNAGNGCEPLTTFYQDSDGDGVGGTGSTLGCTPPAGYKAAGGDCDDNEARAFPGQTAYFNAGYTTLAGALSFDFDCDGNEIESSTSSSDHFIGTCGTACDNLGYLTASPARSGAGVNAYCGSTRYRNCVPSGVPVAPRSSQPIGGGCTSTIDVAGAVSCK